MRSDEYRAEISDSLAFRSNKEWEPLYPV